MKRPHPSYVTNVAATSVVAALLPAVPERREEVPVE
jgi:hypothetical protein